jgi:hypothetical protein
MYSYPAEHTQDESELLPAGELAYGLQSVQLLSIFPVAAENLPAAQSLHTALPGTGLNLPAAQAAHVSDVVEIVPVYPALHVHEVTKVLPTADNVFAAHDTQVAALVALTDAEYVVVTHDVHVSVPAVFLYVPAGHPKQFTPLEPGLFAGQNPMLHVQFWI